MMGDFSNDLSTDGFNLDEEEKPKVDIMATIKPYIGPAIKIIILLVVVVLVYYFVWGNKVEITFSATKDGKPYNDLGINIYNGEKLVTTTNVNTPVKLVKGTEYRIEADAPSNYFQYTPTKSLTASSDVTTHEITLLPLWASEIKSMSAEIPEIVYKGQQLEIPVNVDYQGSGATVNVIGTGDFKDLSSQITLKEGNKTYNVVTYIPRDIPSSKKKVSGKICIENSMKCTSNELSAEIKELPNIRLIVKQPEEISAGNSFTLNIVVDNKKNSTTDLRDLNVTIEDVSGLPNSMSDEDFIDLLTIIPPLVVQKSSNNSTIQIRSSALPIDLANSEITFYVIVKNSFLDLRSEAITLKVGAPNITITEDIDFSQLLAGETKTEMITITNNSEVELTNMSVTLEGHTVSSNLLTDFKEWINVDNSGPFNIPARGTYQIRVTFNPGKMASTDQFTLNATISSSTGNFMVPIKGSIKGITVGLTVSAPSDEIRLTKTELGFFNPVNDSIKIKNTGEAATKIDRIEIDASCTMYVKITSLANPIIEPDTEKETAMSINVTNQNMQDKACTINVYYIDPRTEDQEIPEIKTAEDMFWIRVPTS